MKELINMTPHDVVVVDENNNVIVTVKPCGVIPRVEQRTKKLGTKSYTVDGKIYEISESENAYGEVIGLPDYDESKVLIVSRQTADAVKDRTDLRVPNETIRNDKGQIIGCQSIAIV